VQGNRLRGGDEMQLWNREVKEALWRVLISGISSVISCGSSILLASLAYKRWGWHILPTCLVLIVVFHTVLLLIAKIIYPRAFRKWRGL